MVTTSRTKEASPVILPAWHRGKCGEEREIENVRVRDGERNRAREKIAQILRYCQSF